jgi:hypothetical protein
LGTGDNTADHMTLWVYSSEAGGLSEPTSVVQFPKYHIGTIDMPHSAIVGNALYFVIDSHRRILKYDLATQEVNVLLQPPGSDMSCHYWKSRLCERLKLSEKANKPSAQALPTVALGTGPMENFFSATTFCRAPELQALGKGCAESPQWAVGQKK